MPRPRRSDQLADVPVACCEERVVHLDAVREARRRALRPEALAELAAVFGALADPTRLRVVGALAAQEMCVCDLAVAVGQSESAVSHHLRGLRDLGLVRSRREGRRVYYALDDGHVEGLYAQALDHVHHRLADQAEEAADGRR